MYCSNDEYKPVHTECPTGIEQGRIDCIKITPDGKGGVITMAYSNGVPVREVKMDLKGDNASST